MNPHTEGDNNNNKKEDSVEALLIHLGSWALVHVAFGNARIRETVLVYLVALLVFWVGMTLVGDTTGLILAFALGLVARASQEGAAPPLTSYSTWRGRPSA